MESKINGNGNHYPRTPEVTRNDIGYAHDLLATVLDDSKLIEAMQLTEEEIIIMSASMSVLCWILGHENQIFAKGMASLEEELRAMGTDKLH